MELEESVIESVLSERGYPTDVVRTFPDSDSLFVVPREEENDVVIKFLSAATTTEPFVLRRIADAADLPVPTIKHVEVPGPEKTDGFFTMDRLPGRRIDSPRDMDLDDLRTAVRELGRMLGRLHDAMRFDRHGPLGIADGSLVLERGFSWREYFLDSIIDQLCAELDGSQFDEYGSKLRELANDRDAVVPVCPTPRLLHSAYRWEHVLFPESGWTPAGILSWGRASAGHREFELVQAEYWLIDQHVANPKKRERINQAFYDGYEQASEWTRDERFDERRELYRGVAIGMTMAYFDEWADTINALWRRMVSRRYKKDMNAIVD